ncbi:MAG: glycosyltransferase family 39 protein, partial [Planctomycetes bacterium]|nr:glycosyltransferase family 39 protein [Planctomycetota bacterium]
MLHLWMMLVGSGSLWAGPALNILIAAAAILSLFRFARAVWGDPVRSALAAWVWAFSPTVVATSAQARQYDLLALCTILFMWTVWRCADHTRPIGWKHYAALAGMTS